jgi:uncharacterized protein
VFEEQLFIYPIKSLLPVELSMAEITSEGFRFDRQYILVKEPGEHHTGLVEHITIKTTYCLGLFQPSIDDNWSSLKVKHTIAQPESSITLPLTPSPISFLQSKSYALSIFGTRATGVDMGDEAARFFTKHIGSPTRLLYISGSGKREIPGLAYVPNNLSSVTIRTGDRLEPQRIRFADAAPFLVTSSASEENVRLRLPQDGRSEDVLIRFRSNIHIDVGATRAFDEDDWREVTILSEDGSTKKAIIRCIFKTPRCLSLNVDLKTGTTAPRDRQLYGLIAKDRRVNSAFSRMPFLQLHEPVEMAY